MSSLELPSLPPGWSEPEQFVERVMLGRIAIQLAGVAATHEHGHTATGSAAALEDAPLQRAGFELCERIAIMDRLFFGDSQLTVRDSSGGVVGIVPHESVFPSAPPGAGWKYARSSGVAFHREWTEACERAHFEAVERDAVLRSWLGGQPPRKCSLIRTDFVRELERHYELHAVRFDTSSAICVSALFGFPREPTTPLLMSFGAGVGEEDSFQHCEAEALQRVGFLWGEDVPAVEPQLRSDAMSQQEFYLWPGSHGFLRQWLEGRHFRPGGTVPPDSSEIVFADLTPASFGETFVVAKVLDARCIPLVFGEGHPLVPSPELPSMRVQPIA